MTDDPVKHSISKTLRACIEATRNDTVDACANIAVNHGASPEVFLAILKLRTFPQVIDHENHPL